jgi:hypothetical protein
VTKGKNTTISSNVLGENQFPNYLFGLYHSNNIQGEKVTNTNNLEESLNVSNKYRKRSTDHINKNNGIQDFTSVLNEIFESSSKNSIRKVDSSKKEKKRSSENYSESNEIQMPKYDSEKFKNILLEMDKLYKNIEVDDNEKEHSTKNNLQETKSVNFKENNEYDLESVGNQSFESKVTNSKPVKEKVKNEAINNVEENNNVNVQKICVNNIIDKEMLDYIKNAEIKEKRNSNDKLPKQSSLNSHKSEVSNINIYNIHNNINTIRVEENIDLEKIANSFLYQELSKTSLHWLISSKDIEIEKKIGYGGSSEVFQANYRGTDVAVKKLRILDVKEENLKEFKREVRLINEIGFFFDNA